MPYRAYNPIRAWEFIACMSCLILSINAISEKVHLHGFVRSTLLVLPAVYGLLTLLDLMIFRVLQPLPWTSWIPLAMVASVMFFLSTGFLISANNIGEIVYGSSLIAYSCAGTLFLFDVIEVIRSECMDAPESDTTTVENTKHSLDQVNKGIQVEIQLEEAVHTKDQATSSDNKKYVTSKSHANDLIKKETRSHGGTFRVSENTTPFIPLRSNDVSDHSYDYHPVRVNIKTVPGIAKRKMEGTSSHVSYQLKCADNDCPCNRDNYVNVLQRKKLSTLVETKGYSNFWDNFSTSNNSSNQDSPVALDGIAKSNCNSEECECDNTAHIEELYNYRVNSKFELSPQADSNFYQERAVWRPHSWLDCENQQDFELPGTAEEFTEPTTAMNVKRCITIKREGTYAVFAPHSTRKAGPGSKNPLQNTKRIQ